LVRIFTAGVVVEGRVSYSVGEISSCDKGGIGSVEEVNKRITTLRTWKVV